MIKYNSHSLQGKRWYQEDRLQILDIPTGVFAAIIDGHGGELTAEYIKKRISDINFSYSTLTGLFIDLHNEVVKKYSDGACLLVANIKFNGEYEIAWVGDCVAFHHKENTTIQLNEIHQLENPRERKRILQSTGKKCDPKGVYLMSSTERDNGIMPTRTIGDRIFEIDGVSHIPEIIFGKIEQNDRLILVTDGVTNVLSENQLNGTAEEIVLRAYNNKSTDNISAIVIELKN